MSNPSLKLVGSRLGKMGLSRMLRCICQSWKGSRLCVKNMASHLGVDYSPIRGHGNIEFLLYLEKNIEHHVSNPQKFAAGRLKAHTDFKHE